MSGFVRTDTILDAILADKVERLSALSAADRASARRDAERALPARDFIGALTSDPERVALIAEVKHASPSKGVLIDPFDPVALAAIYAQNGAAAISVLTDERFFQGHLDHLRAVRAAVDLPLLRKDFVIDAHQVYEARAAGADAVLLIVAALEDTQLADLHVLIESLKMAALVEVHDLREMERAAAVGAALIGINNRDLRTFREDLEVTARLARFASAGTALVAESAIRTVDDVRRMGTFGAHAVLVGEALVKAPETAAAVRAFSSQRRVSEIRS